MRVVPLLALTLSAGAVSTAAAASDLTIRGITIEAKPRDVVLVVGDGARPTRFSVAAHRLTCGRVALEAAGLSFRRLDHVRSGRFSHSATFTRRRGGRVLAHKVSIAGETVNGDPESWAGSFEHRVTVKRRGKVLERCRYEVAWLASS